MIAAGRTGLLVLAVLALAACGGGSGAGIGVGTPTRGTVVQTVDAPATVAARAQGSVTATAAGSVSQLLVRNGQQVRAGQVLMMLVSPAAQGQLAQAKAADAAAARMASGQPAGTAPTTGGTAPTFDVAGVTANVTASQSAATAALDQAAAAAAQLPAGPARVQAVAAVAQLRAQVAAAGAAATGALASLGAGLSSVTGQLSAVGGQTQQVATQLQTVLGALAGAQRTQTRAAVQTAQAVVAGLVVRAPVAGVVQLGTGSAPAGASGGSVGSGLSSLLAQLPASVTSQLGGLAGGAAASAAPSDGATATIPVTAGAPVASGGLLATVFDTSALTLTAEVDETDVLGVAPGVRADVEIDAVPGAHYEAHVTSVDTSAGASAQGGVSYTAHLALGAGVTAEGTRAPSPRPGMSAVATLAVRTEVDAISLPVAALVKDGDRDSVWVVVGGRAVRRDVTLGAQGDTTVAVDSGLGGTEQVVIRGADTVHAGDKV